MKYLEHELELMDWLDYYENRQILVEWLREEAELDEIAELVELVNKALLYRKQKDKKK